MPEVNLPRQIKNNLQFQRGLFIRQHGMKLQREEPKFDNDDMGQLWNNHMRKTGSLIIDETKDKSKILPDDVLFEYIDLFCDALTTRELKKKYKVKKGNDHKFNEEEYDDLYDELYDLFCDIKEKASNK